MKLTGKLVLIYMFVMALLTAYIGYHIVRQENRLLREEMAEQAESLGDAMEREIIVVWQREGHEGIARLIRYADSQQDEMAIRWIALFERDELPDLATTLERLLQAEPGDVYTVAADDAQHMYYPIDVADQRAGVLEFSQNYDEIDEHVRNTIRKMSLLITGMLMCGVVFTLLGIRTVAQRLEQLIEKTRRIGQGDFSKPLELRGNDELNQLATALNEMSQQLAEQQEKIQAESAARLTAVEQLRHVDRLNTVGRLASGVAHELGTPLNVVAGRADLIASGRLEEEASRESARIIKSEADRMTGIIRQLLDFARRRTPQCSSVDLRHVVDQCAELLRSYATKHMVDIVVNGSASLTANVDAAQIQQVLTNLMVNAVQAMPSGGTVSIAVEQRRAQPPGDLAAPLATYSCISVKDEGSGIRDEDRTSLFEPFFTTKDVGDGTGLGLSVSYGIVQDHEGWIVVNSEPGEGSCFSVYLPGDSE